MKDSLETGSAPMASLNSVSAFTATTVLTCLIDSAPNSDSMSEMQSTSAKTRHWTNALCRSRYCCSHAPTSMYALSSLWRLDAPSGVDRSVEGGLSAPRPAICSTWKPRVLKISSLFGHASVQAHMNESQNELVIKPTPCWTTQSASQRSCQRRAANPESRSSTGGSAEHYWDDKISHATKMG
jgi:hypothetical protein